MIETIPHDTGSYLLWLTLPQAQELAIGRLGIFCFPAGDYLYMGSAHGLGGLRARLGRHLRGNGKTHWHIDYLRVPAQLGGFGYQAATPYSAKSLECRWNQKLAALSEVSQPIPGFGASDCRAGCSAHLVHFPGGVGENLARIANQTGIKLRIT